MSKLESFAALGVAEYLLDALVEKGFQEPTDIQKLAIPLLLSGEKDIIGQALTGTGKTAAFGLPILQELERSDAPAALILAPTRELSIQIAGELESLQGSKALRIATIYGGQAIPIQLGVLKKGADIIVGTPGRVMDLYRRKALQLDNLKFAVLDEADEMLDMGFVDDIREILALTNPDKRMLMFSATMPKEIMAIAAEFMRPEFEIARAAVNATNTDLTEQIFHEVKREDKIDALARVIESLPEIYALVFCRTRADVDEVTEKLSALKYHVEALHGEISQAQRLRVIESFKKRKFPVLIATDVAARGIDVNDLNCVINYSMPQNPETYIHRIGRTGRAGKHGIAITFVTPREQRKMQQIAAAIKTDIVKRPLPSESEIIEAKKNMIADDIAKLTADENAVSGYLNFAEQLCACADHPAQVVAALLKLHFGDKLNRIPGLTKPEMKKLLLFAGRVHGLTLPVLLQTISEEAGIRGGALGKIIIKADKTFIEASPKDADKILAVFRDDPELRFKLDDGRDEKRKKERREKPEKPAGGKPSRRERREQEKFAKKAGKADSKPVKRPSLRDDLKELLETGI